MAMTLAKNIETGKGMVTKVFLDSKAMPLPDTVKTVQDLLIHVQTAVLPKDRVLQHILLDGEHLTEKAERGAHQLQVSAYEQVELHSRKVLELALEGLTDAQEIIPSVSSDLLEAAHHIRSGGIKEGMETLHDCISMVEWYMELVEAIETVFHQDKPWLRNKHEEHVAKAGDEFRTFQPKTPLMDKFGELEQAQELQDFVSVADIVEYDIQPVVQVWANELPAILTKMKAENAEA
jgi:hypothetical protein